MAKVKPKTKAAKRKKMSKVLGEQKRGALRTSAGKKPTKKQAVAIALSEAGLSKKKRVKK